jgi:O-methyltransferase
MIRRMLRPLQLAARRFVMLPEDGPYTGTHGCLNTGASFVTWNQVEGDYLEFGVFRGSSFAVAYRIIQNRREPGPSFGDASPESAARQADYAPGAYSCSQDEFKRNIARFGVDLKEVITVPGFYDQTLNNKTKEKYGLRRAALVMIDCDLYESTVPVLEFLTDLVGQGTILIFHDWFRFRGSPKYGEQRACREWLDRNPQLELIEYWREGPQAVSFLVNLR